jgi:drug/metabolite transporter (DMT)-like permease
LLENVRIARCLPSAAFKTNFFVALVILGNFGGGVCLRAGMREAGPISVPLIFSRIDGFLNVWTVLGALLMALGMFSELALFSWADLSYILPVTSVIYILTALSGWCFLHESISAAHWAGILLISGGAALVARTPACRQKMQAAGIDT